MIKKSLSSPIKFPNNGFSNIVIPQINKDKIRFRIVALVTENDEFEFFPMALFFAVIFEIVRGMLEPTTVSKTIKIESVIL